MKTLFVLLTLTATLTSTTTLASSFDSLQTEMARTVAQINAVDETIKTIKLNETGVLTVIGTDGTTTSVKLSENNSEILLTQARSLAEIDAATEIRPQVCEMLLNKLSEQKLSVINLNNNSLKLMLTSSSCANVSYTFPSDSKALNTAKNLKVQLISLGRQIKN